MNSPHRGQWRGALMFTWIYARIIGWVNNREAGDLRRSRAHYDVIVMWNGPCMLLIPPVFLWYIINGILMCIAYVAWLQKSFTSPGVQNHFIIDQKDNFFSLSYIILFVLTLMLHIFILLSASSFLSQFFLPLLLIIVSVIAIILMINLHHEVLSAFVVTFHFSFKLKSHGAV